MHLSLNDALKYGTLRIPSRKVSAFAEGGNNEHNTYFANEVVKHPYAAEQATDNEGNTHQVVGERKGASDSQGTNFVFAPLSNGHFLVHRDLGGESGHVDSAILSPEQVRQWHSELDQFDGDNAASKNRHRFNQALRDHLQNLLLPPADFEDSDKVPLFQNKWDTLPEAEVGTADQLPHELPKPPSRKPAADDSTAMERKGTGTFAGDDTLPHERPPEQWGVKADDKLPWEYRSLAKALKYATKVRASAADYHKAFDRLAADPKAGEGADAKALVPTEFFADHLRSEGHHPQADLIQQAMAHSKEQGEPVVYSEQIAKFPPHHREILEGLGQGDFHLVLGKPNRDYTNAVLYQRSHTDPSKVFGWTDSIDGTPEEVKAEVERFQRAGVPVELAIKPDSPQYQRWAKHFGIGGYSEEAEQYAAVKYVQETHADFKRAIHVNPEERTNALVYADWLQDQGKEAHAALIRKHTEEQGTGATLFADPTQEPTPVLTGDETAFDSDPAAYPNIRLHLHTASPEGGNLGWSATVPHTEWEQWEKKLAEEGAASVPFYLPQVPIEFGDAPLQWDLPEQHSSGERALKYINESHADFLNRILDGYTGADPAAGYPDKVTPLIYADWLQEQGKPAHAEVIRKHVERYQNGGFHHLPQVPFHLVDQTKEVGQSEADFIPFGDQYNVHLGIAGPEGADLHWNTGPLPTREAAALHSALEKEGATAADVRTPLGYRRVGRIEEQQDPVSEHFSAEQPIRYSAVPEHEVHEDYAPNGIAPRIGHTLKQLAQEDSTTGALAEGILRTGDHSILPILADRLEETDHPLAQAFDWRHAPRAIRIDRALHRQISQRQVRHPDGHRVPLTAGWVLADMQDGVQRPAFSRRKALLAARLAVPDATTEDLLHSLFRLMDHREVADTAPELVQPVADHTKALTTARLQKLRQRAANPYQYADTRQQNKRVYSAERVRYSHKGFQSQIANWPKDHTAAAIYADWLDDASLPKHAEFVRSVAQGVAKGTGTSSIRSSPDTSLSRWEPEPTVPFTMFVEPIGDDHWAVHLEGKHKVQGSPFKLSPVFSLHGPNTEQTKSLIEGLKAEGVEWKKPEKDHEQELALWNEIHTTPDTGPEYRDRKQYSSINKALKYSHEAFQQAVAKDPSDWTSGLVYADWLEEQGMPAHAAIVRQAAKNNQNREVFYHQRRELMDPHQKGDTAVRSHPALEGHWWVTVKGKTIHRERGWPYQPEWHLQVPAEEAPATVQALLQEGAENQIDVGYRPFLLPEKSNDSSTKKYGSWRAPAGGMVVQQSPLAVSGQWAEGGEFVNDLQKMASQPVDYKQKPKKRLTVEYLRQHFKKKRVKGATSTYVVSGYSGQEGEADADAGAE